MLEGVRIRVKKQKNPDSSTALSQPSTPLFAKLRRVFRGEVKVSTVAREALRRSRVVLLHRQERAALDQLDKRPARLRRDFSRLPTSALLDHFRTRTTPKFFTGFDSSTG